MASSDVEIKFQQATQLYQSSAFDKALNMNLSILDSEINNDILYYNIANCYFKLNQLGRARLYYERAKKYNIKDEDVNYNLGIVESMWIDDITPVSKFFLVDFIQNTSKLLSSLKWSILLLILLYISLVLILLFLFTRSNKIKIRLLQFLTFFIPMLFISSFFLLYGIYAQNDQYGILISSNCYVKTAPSESSENQFIIHEWVKFQITDKVDDWSRISLIDGKDGWVQTSTFEPI